MEYVDRCISNDIVSVRVVDGNNIVISNLEKGIDIYNANILEDIADVGDEYRYQSPCVDRVILNNSSLTEVSIVDNSPVSSTLVCKYDLKLPKCFDYSLNKRSEEFVSCPVTVEYTVEALSDVVKIKTTFENNAKDHKVRALFPSECETDYCLAEMPFDVVKRDIRVPKDWQESSRVMPLKTWFALEDSNEQGDRFIGILSKGLQEYEILPDEQNTMALTLFRSINKISNEGDTGNIIYTPDAWYLGKHVFEYGVYISDEKYSASNQRVNDIVNVAHDFNAPMVSFQSNAIEKGKTPKTANMEPIYNFLAISDERIVLSALKRAENNDGIILRMYNPYFEDIKKVEIKFFKAKSAERVNLNEEFIEKIPMKDETISVDFGAKKIVTIKFKE